MMLRLYVLMTKFQRNSLKWILYQLYLSMAVTTMKYLMWLILWIPYWTIWNKQSTSCKLCTNSWNIKAPHHVWIQVHLSQLNKKHYVHFWISQRLNYWVRRKYDSWAWSSKNPRRHKKMPWVGSWVQKMTYKHWSEDMDKRTMMKEDVNKDNMILVLKDTINIDIYRTIDISIIHPKLIIVIDMANQGLNFNLIIENIDNVNEQ